MTIANPSASGVKCSIQSSLLLIIDIQQQLGQAMPAKVLNRIVTNSALLTRSAALLDVPIMCTEQYPKGLGPTVKGIAEALPATTQSFAKTTFSCLGTTGFADALAQTQRQQIVIVGMEAHIYIQQTTLDLLAVNFQVYVVEDAVCSRRLENYQNALERLRQSNASVVSAESVIFEWLVGSRHEHFKTIQAMLR